MSYIINLFSFCLSMSQPNVSATPVKTTVSVVPNAPVKICRSRDVSQTLVPIPFPSFVENVSVDDNQQIPKTDKDDFKLAVFECRQHLKQYAKSYDELDFLFFVTTRSQVCIRDLIYLADKLLDSVFAFSRSRDLIIDLMTSISPQTSQAFTKLPISIVNSIKITRSRLDEMILCALQLRSSVFKVYSFEHYSQFTEIDLKSLLNNDPFEKQCCTIRFNRIAFGQMRLRFAPVVSAKRKHDDVSLQSCAKRKKYFF